MLKRFFGKNIKLVENHFVRSVYLPVTLSCYISCFIFVFGELKRIWFIEIVVKKKKKKIGPQGVLVYPPGLKF